MELDDCMEALDSRAAMRESTAAERESTAAKRESTAAKHESMVELSEVRVDEWALRLVSMVETLSVNASMPLTFSSTAVTRVMIACCCVEIVCS